MSREQGLLGKLGTVEKPQVTINESPRMKVGKTALGYGLLQRSVQVGKPRWTFKMKSPRPLETVNPDRSSEKVSFGMLGAGALGSITTFTVGAESVLVRNWDMTSVHQASPDRLWAVDEPEVDTAAAEHTIPMDQLQPPKVIRHGLSGRVQLPADYSVTRGTPPEPMSEQEFLAALDDDLREFAAARGGRAVRVLPRLRDAYLTWLNWRRGQTS